MRIDQWSTELVALLQQCGIPAVTDPRNVIVPGAFVAVRRITGDRLSRGPYTVEWSVTLIAGGGGTPAALKTLGDLAALLEESFPGLVLEAAAISLPNVSPDPMPALSTTITIECEDTP